MQSVKAVDRWLPTSYSRKRRGWQAGCRGRRSRRRDERPRPARGVGYTASFVERGVWLAEVLQPRCRWTSWSTRRPSSASVTGRSCGAKGVLHARAVLESTCVHHRGSQRLAPTGARPMPRSMPVAIGISVLPGPASGGEGTESLSLRARYRTGAWTSVEGQRAAQFDDSLDPAHAGGTAQYYIPTRYPTVCPSGIPAHCYASSDSARALPSRRITTAHGVLPSVQQPGAGLLPAVFYACLLKERRSSCYTIRAAGAGSSVG